MGKAVILNVFKLSVVLRRLALEWTKYIIGGTLALLGGLAKQMHSYLTQGKKLTWRHVTARAIVSGFVGYLFIEAALRVDPSLMGVAAGIGGWLGADGVTFLIERFKK